MKPVTVLYRLPRSQSLLSCGPRARESKPAESQDGSESARLRASIRRQNPRASASRATQVQQKATAELHPDLGRSSQISERKPTAPEQFPTCGRLFQSAE